MVAVADKGIGTQTGDERGPEKSPTRFWSRLLRTFHGLIKRDRYDPAKHYMRGPGPASLRREDRVVNNDER
jgi:hypothetical protein